MALRHTASEAMAEDSCSEEEESKMGKEYPSRPEKIVEDLRYYFQTVTKADLLSVEEQMEGVRTMAAKREIWRQTVLRHPWARERAGAMYREVYEAGPKRFERMIGARHGEELGTTWSSFRRLYARMSRMPLCGQGKQKNAQAMKALFCRHPLHVTQMEKIMRDSEQVLPSSEMALVRCAHRDWLAVREKMTLANTRLVVKMAQRYQHRGLSSRELFQEGNLGLLRGLDRFDPSLDWRVSTYVAWLIRQAITSAIGDKSCDPFVQRRQESPARDSTIHSRVQKRP